MKKKIKPSESKVIRKSVVEQVSRGFLQARIKPETYEEKENTIDVVASTGARGKRWGWDGAYYEELSMERDAVLLDRLNNGAPVLNSHNSFSLGSVIGVVERAWLDDGKLMATLRLSKEEQDATLVSKIKDGIIRNISVGYDPRKYEKLEEKAEDGLSIYRAVEWEPVEISFVAVPFDQAAQVRSAESGETKKTECEIIFNDRGEEMPRPKQKRSQDAEVQAESQVETQEETQEVQASESEQTQEVQAPAAEETRSVDAVALERKRVETIYRTARKAGLDDSVAAELVEKGASLERASEIILEKWSERGVTLEPKTRVSVETDPVDHKVRGMETALLHRSAPANLKMTEEAREFASFSMLDMARDLMEARNIKTRGLSRHDIARNALNKGFWARAGLHSTSDFTSILENVANKSLTRAYDETGRSFVPFVTFASNPDFKDISVVSLGEAPSLSEIGEHGEYTYGTMGERKEVYRIKRYGKAFGVTIETLVNDDLRALTRIPSLFGAAGARLEGDLVYGILNSNPLMGDNVALFDAAHGNLGIAGAIGDTTLSEMRELGRLQTGVDGVARLNIQHQFLVVPAHLEVAALKAVSAVVPNQTSGVNVFAGLYQVIAEPRLDTASQFNWYGIANPSQIDTIEVSYLDGMRGVQLQSETDWDTDGLKFKASHMCGVKALDWRGMMKNPYAG